MECLFCGCGNLRGAGDVDMGDEVTQRGVTDAQSVGVDEFYERQRRNSQSDPTSREIEDHVTGHASFRSRPGIESVKLRWNSMETVRSW